MVSKLASHPTAPGSIPQHSQIFFRGKIINVGEVNQGTGLRKLDSGLKMLIKPISLWLAASQFYKNTLHSSDQLRGAVTELCRNPDGDQQLHRHHLRLRRSHGGRNHHRRKRKNPEHPFFTLYLFPNKALIFPQQMALLGFCPATLCRGVIREMACLEIRTSVSQ